MIEGLIEKGHAYEADGDVYFRVRTFDDYGKLSGRNVDDMVSGARIEIDERKEDPLDFALWKAAKPGEPTWPSPWSDWPPGLAYRVLGHVLASPERTGRYPRRRHRSDLPAP